MENVLKKIVDKKKEKIEIYKKTHLENKLIMDIKNIKSFKATEKKLEGNSDISFFDFITNILISF